MIVEVRPIERERWHQKRGKENFSRPRVIRALVDSSTSLYSTGLSESDIAMLREKGVTYDLTPFFNQNAPHPFWDSEIATVKLPNYPVLFNTDNPLEFIRLKILKASPFVANSIRELDEGLFPSALFVIIDESEEVEAKASKIALKNKAFMEVAKLSKERKIQLILILRGKNLKGKSDDFVDVEMDNLLEKETQSLLSLLEKDKEDVALRALIVEALQKNVLQKKGAKYYYFDAMLGSDIEDVIKYFKDVENQELKLRIMSQLN